MKVERWEEETDEEWAERLTEEIAIANNTEISEYFVERDSYAEDAIIINYIGEGAWTWKEHPEGPFKADQIIEWKKKAEKLPIYVKQYRHMTEHALELEDKLEAVKGVTTKYETLPTWERDMVSYMGLLQEIKDALQSSSGSAKK